MFKSERKTGAANDMNVVQIKKKWACSVSGKKLISTTSKCNLITLKSFLSYKVKYFIDYNYYLILNLKVTTKSVIWGTV